jgi:tetratricopeptide (TPR) repeat protein
MPTTARDKIVAQAQGVPLYAVETVRSLVDRDVVQPIDGVYRLVGDVGELEVPDSLHALLAARLDVLAPDVRRLVADAAVLGASFPAEALLAISDVDVTTLHEWLGELLRREVLTVSADPLSPERGSYRFAQDLLRQVAYDTLSRRDRKARHLAVAAHLRTAFPNDGEEVVDVLARHYLDAMTAVPDDDDVDELRDRAIAALVRGAERAARTGAPDRASRSFAEAAELLEAAGTDPQQAAAYSERAARQAHRSGDATLAIRLGRPTLERYLALGDERSAARTRTLIGRAHARIGQYDEARAELRPAIEVLAHDPDSDTVEAMGQLATVEVFAGSADADAATVKGLKLAQSLGLGPADLAAAIQIRGTLLSRDDRHVEAIFHLREGVRLAEQADRPDLLAVALGNLGTTLMGWDPAGAAEINQRAIQAARRTGDRRLLAVAVVNSTIGLMEVGRWVDVDTLLAPGGDVDTLPESIELGRWAQAVLAALRGDGALSTRIVSELTYMPASADPEDLSAVELSRAFAAAASDLPDEALRHAQQALTYAEALSLQHEVVRFCWPLATRITLDRGDLDLVDELLALLPVQLPGLVPPLLRAERQLVLARRAELAGDEDAGAAYAAAVAAMRDASPPHLLAHGLLDHAAYLAAHGDVGAAAEAVEEAREIGDRLRCRPVLDRADALSRPAARSDPAPVTTA